MTYQRVTGPLMGHSSNGCDGQDANNDMLVTERRRNELGWHTDISHADRAERGGGAAYA